MENKLKIYEKPWFIWVMVFCFWPVGLFLLWRSDIINKKRKYIGTGVVLIFLLLSWSSIDTKKIATNPTSTVTQSNSLPISESKPATIIKREKSIGVSNKDINSLDISFIKSVRNDKTNNWRLAKFSKSEDFIYYAKSYANKFFKNDKEIHAVINFSYKTTTAIRKYGNELDITVHEYMDKEEHDASKLFGGMVLQHYSVYLDNGDIEEIK